MSSDHSPAGSNASQNPLEPDVLNMSERTAYEELITQDGSGEVMAGTGLDRQSVPANEVVNEASTESKRTGETSATSMRATMSSMMELLIQQQEEQAAQTRKLLLQQQEFQSAQTRALLRKMAQILDGKESTASPNISTEKTSYIGVVVQKICVLW